MALPLLAAVGICWSTWAAIEQYRTGDLQTMARAVVKGRSFAPGSVETTLAHTNQAALQQGCDERSLAALLFLYSYLENAKADNAADLERGDQIRSQSEEAAGRLASCNPSQSLAWLVLYKGRLATNGFDEKAKRLLAMSYSTAPREAWIAAPRSALAVRVFKYLDPALQQRVIDDAMGLAQAGLKDATVHLYLAGSPVFKRRLLTSLVALDTSDRQGIMDAFDRAHADVPAALEIADGLPWHQKSGF